MDISITAVTKNRKFGKACVRLRWFLEGMDGSCEEIDTTSEPFDILQIVFTDRPESYLVVRGTQGGDRLFQVHVGLGVDRLFAADEDHESLRMIAAQVLRAVRESSLSVQARDSAVERIEAWRDSLGERFDEPDTTSA
jgi:hypothetical protein